jgi:hypothetical protein
MLLKSRPKIMGRIILAVIVDAARCVSLIVMLIRLRDVQRVGMCGIAVCGVKGEAGRRISRFVELRLKLQQT